MLSIIICSINTTKFDAISRHYAQLLGPTAYEIIRIPDAQSMCEGYNRGVAHARGEHLIFCHDDIEIWTPDFPNRLRALLAAHDVIGVAGTSRLIGASWVSAGPPFIHGHAIHRVDATEYSICIYGAPRRVVTDIQAVDGLFIACRREVAEKIPWDAQTFTGFHCYDVDWSFRAHRTGFRLAIALDLRVCHFSGGSYDQVWQQYATAFMAKHQSALKKLAPRKFRFAVLAVPTRQDVEYALDAMCGDFGDMPQPPSA